MFARKTFKKQNEYTVMVVGEKGVGKTTLINSLFYEDNLSVAMEKEPPNTHTSVLNIFDSTNSRWDDPVIFSKDDTHPVNITATKIEIDRAKQKYRLTVVEVPGFGEQISTVDDYQPVMDFIENQYEKFLNDESGLERHNIVDNRVHLMIYMISPNSKGCKKLDLLFLKKVHELVNIIPVIAKADTLTLSELQAKKQAVMESLVNNGIKLYSIPEPDEDESELFNSVCSNFAKSIPLAIITPDPKLSDPNNHTLLRRNILGTINVGSEKVCDYTLFKNLVTRTHISDLREVTERLHYENFRMQKLSSFAQKRI